MTENNHKLENYNARNRKLYTKYLLSTISYRHRKIFKTFYPAFQYLLNFFIFYKIFNLILVCFAVYKCKKSGQKEPSRKSIVVDILEKVNFTFSQWFLKRKGKPIFQ